MKRRVKGDGTIRKRKDGLWEGRYKNSIGENRYIYGRTRNEVSQKLKETIYAKNISSFDNIAGDVEFDVWIKHYYEVKEMGIKKRSLNQIKMAYKNYIQPILGKRLMCQITANDILAVINSVKNKGLSDNTVRNIITHFRTMINYAVWERVIVNNPMIPVMIEKKPKIPRRDLKPEEVDIILKSAKEMSEKLYLMIYILVTTGIRVGELCGLKWDDFESNLQSVYINESRTDNIYEKTTKSETSIRCLPICSDLRTMLKNYRQKNNNKEYGGYVFISRVRRPYTDQSIENK